MAAREPMLIENHANQRWLLEVLAKGEYTRDEAAELLGTSWKTIWRYCKAHTGFHSAIQVALKSGRRARKFMTRQEVVAAREGREPPPAPKPRKPNPPRPPVEPEEPVSEVPDPLARAKRPAPPGGGEWPELSVQAYLDEMWRIVLNRDNEETRVVTTAMRALGGLIVQPVITGHAEVPVQVIPEDEDHRPRVVLMAPDNGTYAPGCGPVADPEQPGLEAVEVEAEVVA